MILTFLHIVLSRSSKSNDSSSEVGFTSGFFNDSRSSSYGDSSAGEKAEEGTLRASFDPMPCCPRSWSFISCSPSSKVERILYLLELGYENEAEEVKPL